jgi:hypothetical protein
MAAVKSDRVAHFDHDDVRVPPHVFERVMEESVSAPRRCSTMIGSSHRDDVLFEVALMYSIIAAGWICRNRSSRHQHDAAGRSGDAADLRQQAIPRSSARWSYVTHRQAPLAALLEQVRGTAPMPA